MEPIAPYSLGSGRRELAAASVRIIALYEKLADERLAKLAATRSAEARVANMQASIDAMTQTINQLVAERDALKGELATVKPFKDYLDALARAEADTAPMKSAQLARAVANMGNIERKAGLPLFERHY